MSISVSIVAEIPEELHESLQNYLETHPAWDQDRVFAAALSLFLLENEKSQTNPHSQDYFTCARVYLETLLGQSNY
ncbi:hypothetical protein NIES593_18290 [Hydrococcus rivularis NIES-593]|uniref:DUF2811 domain-containing protein n=1 Tax=Hydrococcus rivularis NIES-593 TaxID=1921803 RepID=A0A1U7HAM3_9CYAN|nr:DUF2811 domain-containing protein [Hydrococcus rivularis]OKH20629.1 hypothetical protein NIES593_18290 [Hydrococcus rivularis NIES-593]